MMPVYVKLGVKGKGDEKVGNTKTIRSIIRRKKCYDNGFSDSKAFNSFRPCEPEGKV